jgi:hypothetical protein
MAAATSLQTKIVEQFAQAPVSYKLSKKAEKAYEAAKSDKTLPILVKMLATSSSRQDLFAKDHKGHTILHKAAEAGAIEVLTWAYSSPDQELEALFYVDGDEESLDMSILDAAVNFERHKVFVWFLSQPKLKPLMLDRLMCRDSHSTLFNKMCGNALLPSQNTAAAAAPMKF